MREIEAYLSQIDRTMLKSKTVCLHLYRPNTCQHFLFFDFFNFDEEDETDMNCDSIPEYCCILSSPSLIYQELAYAELSTIPVKCIDRTFGDCIIYSASPYVNQSYEIAREDFFKWEEQLHSK